MVSLASEFVATEASDPRSRESENHLLSPARVKVRKRRLNLARFPFVVIPARFDLAGKHLAGFRRLFLASPGASVPSQPLSGPDVLDGLVLA